jgi:hypothetical protein
MVLQCLVPSLAVVCLGQCHQYPDPNPAQYHPQALPTCCSIGATPVGNATLVVANVPTCNKLSLINCAMFPVPRPPVVRQVSGFMSDPDTQAQSYWYLGTAALTTALACLILPGPVASYMLAGAPDAVVKTLVRAAGATLITSAAVKYTLKVGQAGTSRDRQGQAVLLTHASVTSSTLAWGIAWLPRPAVKWALQTALHMPWFVSKAGSWQSLREH